MCGLRSPYGEVVCNFQDFDGNLIIIFERLSGRGLEGFHASVAVTRHSYPIRFEVEPAVMDDTEEGAMLVQPVSAEHRAAGDTVQIG